MNERVKLIRKQLGMTQEQLAQRLGIGKAALSMIETGKAGLSARNRNILVQELNVNPDWIETGKGNMFNAEPDLTAYMHRTDNSLPLQSVPLYSIEGTAVLVPLFTDRAQSKPVNFIHIPNLPKCDGAIYIVGDSMYPLLKSGDIVLYKQLRDINDIFWGDMYLLSIDIDGEEYVTVKYIQKSDRAGYVKLVSQNQHHADKGEYDHEGDNDKYGFHRSTLAMPAPACAVVPEDAAQYNALMAFPSPGPELAFEVTM